MQRMASRPPETPVNQHPILSTIMNYRRLIFTSVIPVILQCLLVLPTRAEDPRSKVVCFGDSITKRGYPKIMGELLDAEAMNAGIAGHTSSQGLHRMPKDVLAENPDVVVIFFGTNDLRVDSNKYVTPKKYAENLVQMIDACRASNAKAIICTLPPINEETYFTRHETNKYDGEGGLTVMIGNYRQAAIKVASENKVSLVDLNHLLPKTPQWLSHDGVHPSPKGCEIIAGLVAEAVRPLLK